MSCGGKTNRNPPAHEPITRSKVGQSANQRLLAKGELPVVEKGKHMLSHKSIEYEPGFLTQIEPSRNSAGIRR